MKIIALAVALTVGTAGLAQAGTVAVTGAGTASGSVTATSAAGATTSPFSLGNFGSSTTNGLVSTAAVYYRAGLITFSPDVATPQAGVYAGSVSNIAVSAYAGTSLAPSTMEYLAAEPGDAVTLTYNNARNVINLLWGSVDLYNSLDLETIVAGVVTNDLKVTGASVLAAEGATSGTSAFVSVTDATPFNVAVFSTTQNAFEFVPNVTVPEPVSMALLGTGLMAMGGIVSRRRKTA